MEQKYTYFAFISYKREDEKWASWLQHKLERYKLPYNLNGRTDLPKHIRPVFKDTSELSAGILADEINAALDQSKYLIVICSPNASKSKWVNKEVQAFIDGGRSEHIIPFIIGGNPFSKDDSNECFPRALRDLKEEEEILGVNINEAGRDAALVKVVARMFDLKFDTLWQRYERERKKRWMLIIGAAFLFALLSLGVGIYIAHQNSELERVNKVVTAERDRANQERDKAERFGNSLLIANDSIQRQQGIIRETNEELSLSNIQLAKERDNALRSQRGMMINQARFVSERALQLVEEGDIIIARQLAAAVLPADLKGETDRPYVHQAEYALRSAWTKSGAILRGHTQPVNVIAVSPDGRKVASGGSGPIDGIRIWDANTGKQSLPVMLGHTNKIESLSFSPDGKVLVSGSNDGTLRVWSVETGELLLPPLEGCDGPINAAAFNPDGNTLLSAAYKSHLGGDGISKLRVWDIKTGHQISSPLNGLELQGWVRSLEFSTDATKIVSGSVGGDICVWDAKTGEQILGPMKGTKAVISSDGKRIVSIHSDSIYTWNTQTGKALLPSINHRSKKNGRSFINGIIILPNSYNFYTYSNESICYWDMEKEVVYTIPRLSLRNMALFPGGKKIVSDEVANNGLCIWEPNMSGKVHPEKHFMLSAAYLEHEGDVCSVCYSPDGTRIASSSDDNTICIWDAKTGKRLMPQLRGHMGPVNSIAFSPDGKKIVSGSEDKTVRVWDAQTGVQTLPSLNGHSEHVKSVSFSPDGKKIVSASSHSIRIWDAKTGKPKGISIEVPKAYFYSVSFTPDGKKIVAGGLDKLIRIWDAETRQLIMPPLKGNLTGILCLAVSPIGDIIATGSDDGLIRMWSIKTGEPIGSVVFAHSGDVTSIAFSPDGKRIVSCGLDGLINIWDCKTGEMISPPLVTGFSDLVNFVEDKEDIDDFDEEDEYYADEDDEDDEDDLDGRDFVPVIAVSFSPDGQKVVAGCKEGVILLWDVSLESLLQKTRTLYPPLTAEERTQYYL